MERNTSGVSATDMNIDAINNLTANELEARLQKCCHCAAWAERVAGSAPFLTAGNLVECCSGQWLKATEEEILEAFSGHPQIGDMTSADESVLLALRDQNQAYLEKFGFIFIVCATGKSASEMLALLEARINNSRDDELTNGAIEQGEIMKLRLEKLLEDD
jgi:2-oxo-4-hydroxy-4-carboxy-5-ureidoimidazoline decarboxylase